MVRDTDTPTGPQRQKQEDKDRHSGLRNDRDGGERRQQRERRVQADMKKQIHSDIHRQTDRESSNLQEKKTLKAKQDSCISERVGEDAFQCACVGGMQSLYHYTHYTSCF